MPQCPIAGDATEGDIDATSSYHIYASCFTAMMWGKLCEMLLVWHHFLSKIVITRTFS